MNVPVTLVALIVILMELTSVSVHAGMYTGPHSQWVDRLLSQEPSWECPGTRPMVTATCKRDREVGRALSLAWEAECSAQAGSAQKARQAAEQMMGALRRANGMCSTPKTPAKAEQEPVCTTDYIFTCGGLE